MNVLDAVYTRRSVRKFSTRPVDDAAVEMLLEAACRAPSAGNLQPWFFYVVRDLTKKQHLARAALGQSFVAEAPLCIVACAVPEQSARVYRERGTYLYCLQDTAAAVQNLMLAAVERGLGTCWVGAFDEDRVRLVLDIPPERRPVALIPVGYPVAKTGISTSRKSLAEVSAWV